MLAEACHERFGVEAPAAVVQALERGEIDSEEFALMSLEQVLGLEFLDPSVPLRFIPLLKSHGGDFVGPYYPRLGGAPFAASFGLVEGDLAALTFDFESLLAAPDDFARGNPEMKLMSREDLYATGLLINPDSPDPSRELLKPMALHYRMLKRKGMETFVVLIERVKTDQSSASAAAHFQKPLDLHSVEKWTAFSRLLASAERFDDALQALENAHSILTIYPHYGFPDIPSTQETWDVATELFNQMRELLKKGAGDQLDRAVIEYQCEHDWREEEAKQEAELAKEEEEDEDEEDEKD